MNRKIQYYRNFFIDFYNSLDAATQRKIAYVLQYIKTEQRWNEKYSNTLQWLSEKESEDT